MAEAQSQPQREKRPVYTMDIMRLMRINDLTNVSDNFYIELETGIKQRIIPLRATLKTLWNKVKRFVIGKYPKEAEKILKLFDDIDNIFDFEIIEKNNEEKFLKAKRGLILIKETLDEIIDEIWVKSYEVLSEEERARLYSIGRA